jgi:hypothetical protein
MGRSEAAKAMAGRDLDLAQAATRQGFAIPYAPGLKNLFDAACALESPTRTVLAGNRGKPAKRPASNINCHIGSGQSNTACCRSSRAFNSSRRPLRALPASVFISASAIGSMPGACRLARAIRIMERGDLNVRRPPSAPLYSQASLAPALLARPRAINLPDCPRDDPTRRRGDEQLRHRLSNFRYCPRSVQPLSWQWLAQLMLPLVSSSSVSPVCLTHKVGLSVVKSLSISGIIGEGTQTTDWPLAKEIILVDLTLNLLLSAAIKETVSAIPLSEDSLKDRRCIKVVRTTNRHFDRGC